MHRTWLVAVGVACLLGAPAAEAAAADGGTVLLATGSYWRAFAMSGQIAVDRRFLKDRGGGPQIPKNIGPCPTTLPPPADWTGAAFDDSWWFRSPGPFGGLPRGCLNLYLRGRFRVADPAGVRKLALSVEYRGGLIVYLNGTEVLRKDMPTGTIGPQTPADAYPPETYVDAKGTAPRKPLPGRERKSGPVTLPTGLLRKGVNCLSVEIHHAALRPEAMLWKQRYVRARWGHVQLNSIRLTAEAGDGAIMPNVARPGGVQVFNQDIHRIFSTKEYGDAAEPLRPIVLTGARNGFHSGQVVIASTSPVAGLSATVTDLTGGGGARIPASAVRLRYASLSDIGITETHDGLSHVYRWLYVPAFAALNDEPPKRIEPTAMETDPTKRAALGLPAAITPVAMQPVWITVHVPTDATAGTYGGKLILEAGGTVVARVPIELEVVDWTLPDARAMTTFMAINQSPGTLAIRYGVPMWSPRHWKLIEESFELLGTVGNNLLVVPLVNRTQYGNDACMVPWIRQRDGGYEFDFSVLDRYTALARKHCNVRVISYQVYLSQGWGHAPPEKPTFVTVRDPATGQSEPMQLPAYGTPEAKKLWRPLIAGLREHLKRQGIGKETLLALGVSQDSGIHKQVVAHFRDVFPEAGWHYGAHTRRIRGGNHDFVFTEYLYVWVLPLVEAGRHYGWRDNRTIVVMSQRLSDVRQPPMVTRTIAERALVRGDCGAGRMCLDYWPVLGESRYKRRSLYSRWPQSTANQRTPQLQCLALPGPDGPVSTLRLEPMREGLQEAEARIFIERALVNKKVTRPLAREAQAVLDRRIDELHRIDFIPYEVRTACNAGWRASSAALYRTAARIAGRLRP